MVDERRCSRLGEHDPHHWRTRRVEHEWSVTGPQRFVRLEFWCNGSTVTEGGEQGYERTGS